MAQEEGQRHQLAEVLKGPFVSLIKDLKPQFLNLYRNKQIYNLLYKSFIIVTFLLTLWYNLLYLTNLSPYCLGPMEHAALKLHCGQYIPQCRPHRCLKIQRNLFHCWRCRKGIQDFLKHLKKTRIIYQLSSNLFCYFANNIHTFL